MYRERGTALGEVGYDKNDVRDNREHGFMHCSICSWSNDWNHRGTENTEEERERPSLPLCGILGTKWLTRIKRLFAQTHAPSSRGVFDEAPRSSGASPSRGFLENHLVVGGMTGTTEAQRTQRKRERRSLLFLSVPSVSLWYISSAAVEDTATQSTTPLP